MSVFGSLFYSNENVGALVPQIAPALSMNPVGETFRVPEVSAEMIKGEVSFNPAVVSVSLSGGKRARSPLLPVLAVVM